MLSKLSVQGFKSLEAVDVDLPRLTVLFGANTAGKSNFIDALQALSRVASERTLSAAFSEPIRGYPIEFFSFPEAGLPGLLGQQLPKFRLAAEVSLPSEKLRYEIEVGIHPNSGVLSVEHEYLASLTRGGDVRGGARIETSEGRIKLRARAHPGRPRLENIGLNYALISDLRLGGAEYRAIESCRNELAGWRTYYLDPRSAMRNARSPADVQDIGTLGQSIAPFLYRLRAEKASHLDELRRTLRVLIPTVQDVSVDLDPKRGILDVLVKQEGTEFSSRVISEGTLRVLGLCAIAINPWGGSLVAFEEPENGVHPRRLEMIAELLISMVARGKQVVVTTHSLVFCNAVLNRERQLGDRVGVFAVRRADGSTRVEKLSTAGPLFTDSRLRDVLATPGEDAAFSELVMRGLIDA